MARKTLIQIYICLAYARRFFNIDIFSPLFYRQRSTFLPGVLRIPEEVLVSSKVSSDEQSYQRMKEDKMHRLFMPMTCAIKLCDIVKPPMLAHKVAQYIAEISPYCATIPVLFKYVQDIQSYIDNEYDIEKVVLIDLLQEIQINWVLQTLKSINQMDTFFQQFRKSGRVVFSFMDLNTVPIQMYEIVGLRYVLERLIETDWGNDSYGSRRVRESVNALMEKLDSHGLP
ncbi:hypothetical protein Clacol_008804 [Clathrus columnatus]|uniref:Uncharacterized protein n=1 Tax=Clathrus columnatus TaxID=1419009 RepID=A0AAV5AN27_9AGAM|nr:hypothetical protein Clacol_008804 [Clathrus columnatus]